ncbi:MAG: deoxynucleoside kinase [Balneolaceae bacterium]
MSETSVGKKESPIQYLAISGNIGVGKSSLTDRLAAHYDWEPCFESVENNPYLSDFYSDMRGWSFHLQIFFLTSRFRAHKQMLESGIRTVVQDRTIYEDAEIFARNLNRMGLMNDRDYKNYRTLYEEVIDLLAPPGLLVYLRARVPTLVRQIQKRGRPYERSLRIDYLERLNELYEEWIESYPHPKLIIDTDDTDFVSSEDDLGIVLDRIDHRIQDLF